MQNWFLLFSPNEKHYTGISMIGIPPDRRILILKTDIEEYQSPHSRKCPYVRAIQNNYELIGAFIKRAEKSTSLTKSRKTWLKASKVIFNNWADWQAYLSGNLTNPTKRNLEIDLIEALTGSRELSNVNNEALSKFTKPETRAFNTWIKKTECYYVRASPKSIVTLKQK